jgi:glycosyltransferase involved in cell wall biosynthesis
LLHRSCPTSRASPPYILCVATLYRYKNLSRLLEAFARLKAVADIPHRLRIVGGEADLSIAELANEAKRLGIREEVDLIGALPHGEIAAEYAGASAFVYPSLSETFGFPPLEAMTMGVPVVASGTGAVAEIVGDAAELVDPLNIEDIARGLARVLLDSVRARALVDLGRQRVGHFSWDKSAQRTFAAIQSAIA